MAAYRTLERLPSLTLARHLEQRTRDPPPPSRLYPPPLTLDPFTSQLRPRLSPDSPERPSATGGLDGQAQSPPERVLEARLARPRLPMLERRVVPWHLLLSVPRLRLLHLRLLLFRLLHLAVLVMLLAAIPAASRP